ncbi:MAG: DUF4255 domain-containing protein [Kouleothrix sp.]
MSNDQAIAAVTLTLRSLLDREFNAPLLLPPAPDLSGTRVSVRPPDRARDGFTGNQVNLFMFQTNTNAALRNTDLPLRIRADGRGFPPLALNLLYLVTAYGRDGQDPDLFAHRLLGRAMSVLHDTPLLTADQLRAAWWPSCPIAICTSRSSMCASPRSRSRWRICRACGRSSDPVPDLDCVSRGGGADREPAARKRGAAGAAARRGRSWRRCVWRCGAALPDPRSPGRRTAARTRSWAIRSSCSAIILTAATHCV